MYIKSVVTALLLLCATAGVAQTVPDSVRAEIARLTCECVTLMKIDESENEAGIRNFQTCAAATIDVFAGNGNIKKNWKEDENWTADFFEDLIGRLEADCPVFKRMVLKLEKDQAVPQPLEKTDPRYFLSADAMTARNMELNVNAGNAQMKRWTSKDMAGSTIQIVFDIRYVFGSDTDAAAYLKANLEKMREGGEATTHSLKEFGTDESYVYGDNPRLLGLFGDLDMAQFNFIFRVKTVVAKVFVSASKKASYNDALLFAKEAIARIKAVK